MENTSRKLATCLATIALIAGASHARAELPACEFYAAARARVNDGARVDGNLAVIAPGGKLHVKNDVTFADDTITVADVVRVGRDSSLAALLANDTRIHTTAEIRDGSGPVTLPFVDPFCTAPATFEYGDSDVAVPAGVTAGPIAPGDYRTVRLARGATLLLQPGPYRFRSVLLAASATLRVGAGPASTLDVAGVVKLGREAVLDTELGGPPPVLTVGGSRLRIGRDAVARAVIAAPDARLMVGRGSRLAGACCAAMAAVDKDARLECIDGICHDGTVTGDETCDPPQDDACTGLCRNDCSCPVPAPDPWVFTDVTTAAGITHTHAHDGTSYVGLDFEIAYIIGGVASGDYDADGWIDLYAVGGELGQNSLLRNLGDGTFEDVATAAGVALPGTNGSGPTFADFDGDGDLDLLVPGANQDPIVVFSNRGDGTFEDRSVAAGIDSARHNVGAAFGDYDEDGDLDLAISHWGTWEAQTGTMDHLWRNEGGGVFTPATADAGLTLLTGPDKFFFTFTPTFTDVNNDGHVDLLFVADFNTTEYYLSDGDGTFTLATDSAITDENGMGSAVGDYDNDGDLDWFVSSIYDADGSSEGNWGVTGNRLYRNRGDGSFEDVTNATGVRIGHWGWGSCFADFNLDGNLDIFHVNGVNFPVPEADPYQNDPSMLYLSNGDGTFASRAVEVGLVDTGQGRGIVCFDYDRDGDLDVFIANNAQPARLFRNDLPVAANFLQVTLRGNAPNTEAIGARVYVTTGTRRQMREIRVGSNFASQNPALAHFGLGDSFVVDELVVEWPGGETTTFTDVPANQFITLYEP